MKNLYLAVQQYNKETDKGCAFVMKVGENTNLAGIGDGIKDLLSINIYPKERSYKMVEFWNNLWKSQGRYMYD